MTIPDQNLSIRQLLERFSRGQSIPKSRDWNTEEEDMTEFEALDKFEKLDLAAQIKTEISDFQTNQNKKTPQFTAQNKQASDLREPATEGSEPVKTA